jgi:hypothetical protein
MNGEEKKRSPTTLLLTIGLALVFVIIIFALFSSTPFTSSSQLSKGGLSVKFNGNSSLKSDNYFNLNFTVLNTYDVPLENVKMWVEAGRLFTIASNFLSNITTLRDFPSLPPQANITYFFGNIKVEKIDSEMKDVPIILKISFAPKISKDFTINVVNNNSLQLYGGIENVGIKERKKTSKTPIGISFSFDPKNFVFEEGKRSIAPFKIIIENLGGGSCASEINIKLQSNSNLLCYFNNTKLTAPFEIFIKPSNKLEIPCNYTLSYLKEKDFDSIASNLQLSCNYLETKTFRFTISP